MAETRQKGPQLYTNDYLNGLVAKFSRELADFYQRAIEFLELGEQHPWFKQEPAKPVPSLALNAPAPLEYLWWYQKDPSVTAELKKLLVSVHPYRDNFHDSLTESERAVWQSRLEKMISDFEGDLNLQSADRILVVEGDNIDARKIFGMYIPWQIARNGNSGHLVGFRFGIPNSIEQLKGLSIVKGDLSAHLQEAPKFDINYINGGCEEGEFRPEWVPQLITLTKILPIPIRLKDFGEIYLKEHQQFNSGMGLRK